MSADVCFRHATCPGISEKYELDGAQSRDAARGEARWRGREGPGADGADAIRTRSPGRGDGGGCRTVGGECESWREDPGEPVTGQRGGRTKP